MEEQLLKMIAVPGSQYQVGSDSFYPEQSPVRSIHLNAFAIDAAPVTNAGFARFVAETEYVTVSEKPPDPRVYQDLLPEEQIP